MTDINYSHIDYPHKNDPQNDIIAQKRLIEYNNIEGVRVGDYIIREDGKKTRATYDWGESIQDGGGQTSFYIGEGYISYSGSLNPRIEKSKLKDTGKTEEGLVWIFIHDFWGASRAVHYKMDFRVFEEMDAPASVPAHLPVMAEVAT